MKQVIPRVSSPVYMLREKMLASFVEKVLLQFGKHKTPLGLSYTASLKQDIKLIPARLLECVKHRCYVFRGVLHGTMLKNQAFYFISVGTLLERAERVYQASIKVINKDAVGNKGTDGDRKSVV